MGARAKWSWTLLIVGVLAGRSLAQEASAPAVAPGFGPALPVIIPGVSQTDLALNVAETYSTNVSGGPADLAVRRGLKPADFITNPYASLAISRPVGPGTVYVQGDFGYIDYARNGVLNRSILQLQGGGAAQFGVCQTSLTGAFSRGQVDLSTVILAVSGPIAQKGASDVVEDVAVSFAATCGHSVGFAPTVSISETLVNNNFVALETVNVRQFSSSAGLAYRTGSLGVISATAQYSRTDYPGRTIQTTSGPLQERTETYGGGLTYVTPSYSRLQGQASLSYEILQPYSSADAEFRGVTYGLSLSYAASSNLSALLTVYRQTIPSNNPYALFDLRQSYELRMNYKLGTFTILALGASRRQDRYEDLVIPEIPTPTLETVSRVYLSATRPIGRRLSVELLTGYMQRDANYPGFGYPQIMVGLTATSKF